MKKILCIILVLMPAFSFAGPRVIGGGGDAYALQFVAVAQKLVDRFQEYPMEGIQVEDLKAAVESTVVESTDQLLTLNGVPKDAINYPATQKIIFNRARWVAISEKEKEALVLHEYLGILEVENGDYKISKGILKDRKKPLKYNCESVLTQKKIPVCTDLAPVSEYGGKCSGRLVKKGQPWADEFQISAAAETWTTDIETCVIYFTDEAEGDSCCGG